MKKTASKLSILQQNLVASRAQSEGAEIETWAGEQVWCKVQNVQWVDKINFRATSGDIFLTNYRLIFQIPQINCPPVKLCNVPLTAIASFEKTGKTSPTYEVIVTQKNLRMMYFKFDKKRKDRAQFVNGLNFMLNRDLNTLPAFVLLRDTSYDNNGWNIFHPEKEYLRLGVGPNHPYWRVSTFNNGWKEIPSYPEFIVVPKHISDPQLTGACKNRTRGRIPALVWMAPDSPAAIIRCSQPAVGLKGQTLKHDKELVKAIVTTNTERPLIIIDARSKSAAVANMAVGGGYEDYGGDFRILWMNIANIHVIRDSLNQLRKSIISRTTDGNFINAGKLEVNQWLDHIQLILYGVATSVQYVHEQKKTVLVHCSDGWDRTPQLTGSSMLCLDPYYRTLEGFQVLIEKEWCSFGHKFSQRNGHELLPSEGSSQERSPIFLQWMDVVYQLTKQFPMAFEFNHRILITLIDAVYECKFGTFLFDTPKERQEFKLMTTTTSVWSYINDETVRYKFINPFYEPERYAKDRVLRVSPHRDDIRFWRGFHLRWYKRVGEVSDSYDLLEKRYIDLQREAEELRRRLGEEPKPKKSYMRKEDSDDELDADVDRFMSASRDEARSKKLNISTAVGLGVNATTTTMKRLVPPLASRKRAESTVDWSTIDKPAHKIEGAPDEQSSPLKYTEDYADLDTGDNDIDRWTFNEDCADAIRTGVEEAESELEQIAFNKLQQMKNSFQQQKNQILQQLEAPNLSPSQISVLHGQIQHLQVQQDQIQGMLSQMNVSTNTPTSASPTLPPAPSGAIPARPLTLSPASKLSSRELKPASAQKPSGTPPPVPTRLESQRNLVVSSGDTGISRKIPENIEVPKTGWERKTESMDRGDGSRLISPRNPRITTRAANVNPFRQDSQPQLQQQVPAQEDWISPTITTSLPPLPTPVSPTSSTTTTIPFSTQSAVPARELPASIRDLISSLLKTAETLLTVPIETAYIGDQLRIRLLNGARNIESQLDKSQDAQFISQLFTVIPAFTDATKQGNPDGLYSAFASLVDFAQLMLENCAYS